MNNFAKSVLSCALLCVFAPLGSTYAEDTDIYATAQSGSNPNVLIVLDNSANWSAASQGWPGGIKQGQAELNAIRTVAGEQSDRINIGLMMGTATGVLGGYVRYKIRPMSFTNKDALQHLIGLPNCTNSTNLLNGTPDCIYENFNDPSEKVNSVDYSKMMFEVFKYFGGYTNPANARAVPPVAGSPATAADELFGPYRYAGVEPSTDKYAFLRADGTPAVDPVFAEDGSVSVAGLPSNDSNLTNYLTPIGATSCAKNYVILIGNGFPGTDNSSAFGPTKLAELGGDTAQLDLEVISQTDTTVTTETLVDTTACGKYATIAACESDAASRFGTSTDPDYVITYRCTEASTCTGGTTVTTDLGQTLTAPKDSSGAVLGCNYYPDATACSSGIPQIFPDYDLYTCMSSATTCKYWTKTDSTNQSVATTACITDNLNSGCENYGDINYPNYNSFTCDKVDVIPACEKIGKTQSYAWAISATEIYKSGTNFDVTASKAVPDTGTYYSHKIYKSVKTKVLANVSTGDTAQPTNSNINYADEWARFLNRSDLSAADGFQNLTIFTIDVYKDKPDANQTALLMSMATNAGGKYFAAQDEESIKNALRTIMSEIQAVNSVFASSSLPVSVNTQGTYLNQVFMGMFRPDSSGAPRWAGNIKQYKFKYFGSVLRLADANENQAISTTTGFVTPCAVSYWSSDTGSYWDFPSAQAVGDCSAMTSAFPSGSTSIFSDAPDGEVVEKGGAAQRLRGVKSSGGVLTSSSQNYDLCTDPDTPEDTECRKLFTCDPSTCSTTPTLVSFDTSNTELTATALDCVGTCVNDDLINWVRGQDVDDENANSITNEMRPSVHGGVVHSHPAVVDYGDPTDLINPHDVVAYYGSDDGVFHAVRGNQDVTDGTELWSFIAPEHWALQNRLKENGDNSTAFIDFPNSAATIVAPKEYGFDGGISVYQNVSGNTVWIFSAMRRGGRAIYAFDVSTPTSPTLKWRKGCFATPNAHCSSTDWEDIGQTWSEPVVTYISGYNSPVLIFGGGYDTCEDEADTSRCDATTLTRTPARNGSNIWIVNAATGALIRKYSTYFSVPGDVSVLETDSKPGYATYIYATDTGGHVYRIKVGEYNGTTRSGTWSGGATGVSINDPADILIASLSSTANHERKFISGPIVQTDVGFNAVLVGSGDREAPMLEDYACNSGSGGVINQFYMIIDRPTLSPQPAAATVADLVDVTAAGATFNAATFTVTDNTGSLDTTPTRHSSDRGWRFDFKTCEQSVNRPVVVAGVTFFGTNTPSASTEACKINLGKAEGYAVDYQTGNPVMYDTETGNLVNDVSGVRIDRSVPFIGGGMPPSPVAGVVEIDEVNTPFCIGCIDPTSLSTSALEGGKVNVNPVGSRLRSYWYIETD
jgi:hypothetical protein